MSGINKKLILLTTAFLTLVAGSVFAQPRAVVAEPVKDMGEFHQDQKILYDFVIKNDGNVPLKITDVKAACGCTATDYDKEIAPGKTGLVHTKIDVSTFNGPISKGVTVFTNDASNPQIQLTIQARVVQWVAAQPGYARFSAIQGELDKANVNQVIYSPDGTNFKVTGVTPSSETIIASFREAREEERSPAGKGRQWIVEISHTENTRIGPIAETVMVSTDHPKQQQVKITVSGVIRPPIRVEPTALNFGAIASVTENYATRTIRIRGNNDKTTLNVFNPKITIKGINVKLTATGNTNEYELTLNLDQSLPKGPFSGKVSVQTDNKIKPLIEVDVKGEML